MKLNRKNIKWVIAGILIVTFVPFYNFEEKKIIAKGNSEFISFPFSDGNTVADTSKKWYSTSAITDTQNGLTFKYKLKGPAQFLYAGVFFGFLDTVENKTYDISEFDQVKINLQSTNGKSFPFTILTFEEGVSTPKRELSYRRNNVTIDVQPGQEEYVFDLNELVTPDWWYANLGITQKAPKDPDFSKVRGFAMSSDIFQKAGDSATVSIASVTLVHNNFSLFVFHLSSLLILLGSWWFVEYIKNRKVKVVGYEKVDFISSEEKVLNEKEAVVKFIAENYTNADLEVKTVALAVGLPSYIVSKIIKEQFDMMFKQYLNTIRIEEAKRLLLNSQLTVNEIAYKAGYGTPSHFRRLFKQEMGCSPVDYRKTNNGSEKN